MDRLELLERKLKREKQARKAAESLLENKSLDLFHTNQRLATANEKLKHLNRTLEQKVEDRSRELINSELKYKTIIENMELGLLEVDNNHIIQRAYPSFCQMVGYTPKELEGKNALEVLVTPDEMHFVQAEAQKRLLGQTNIYETRIRHKNGHLIWVLLSGTPIYNKAGEVVGSIGIHYDISDIKNLQHNLERARQEAIDAREAEKQFLANMSHEIRTPLNAIIGMTHLLQDTPLNVEQKDYLNVLHKSANLLLRLISDVLDFSKIESGKFDVQEREFDLNATLALIWRSYQLRLREKPIEFSMNLDSRLTNILVGDDLLLTQMLHNLLSNAEKFTERGRIHLQVDFLERKEERIWVRFTVEDTGIGIEREDQEAVFQSYRQAKSDTRIRYGGTGLGLPITKRLAEMQGGNIRLESEAGKGSRFLLTISYQDTGRLAKPNDSHKALSLVRPVLPEYILVVEDNVINQKYIATLLRKWEVAYDMANDGVEATEKVRAKKYALIFMDLQMPRMNGYEASQAIRETPNPNQQTPIIALTASAIQADREKTQTCGMNGFLSKPFTPAQLLEIIDRFFPQKGNEDVPAEAKGPRAGSENSYLGIDWNYLRNIFGGDMSYAHELVEMFLTDGRRDLDELQQAINHKKWREVKKIANRLKPSVQMVGFTKLSGILADLELAAAQSDHEKINAHYSLFDQYQAGMLEVIKKLRADLENGTISQL